MSLLRGAVAHTVDGRTSDVTLRENASFADLLLSQPVLRGLQATGFERPSPIQLDAIPVGRTGRDLILHAKSGTGKTLVFTIIALEMLDLSSCKPQVLIIAPTREIAVQIKEVITSIGGELPGLKVAVFIGGLAVSNDVKEALQGCHVVVGTPGRIKQLIFDHNLLIDSIRLFVLDEADRLMDESFRLDVRYIFCKLPRSKQTVVASATFPAPMEAFLSRLMVSPRRVQPTLSSVLLGVRQYVTLNPHHTNVLVRVRNKTATVIKVLSSVAMRQCLIFCNFQSKMEGISRDLSLQGWPTVHLAGSMKQQDRLAALGALQNQRCRVLLTTDLAARGIDIQQVDVVINMDLPYDSETHLHRIGRAGRYGAKAVAITIVDEGDELTAFQHLLHDLGGPDYRVSLLPSGEWPSQIWDDAAVLESVTSVSRTEVVASPSSAPIELGSEKSESQIVSAEKLVNDLNSRPAEEKNNKISVGEAKSSIRDIFITTGAKPPFRSYSVIKASYEKFKAGGEVSNALKCESNKPISSGLDHAKVIDAMKALNIDMPDDKNYGDEIKLAISNAGDVEANEFVAEEDEDEDNDGEDHYGDSCEYEDYASDDKYSMDASLETNSNYSDSTENQSSDDEDIAHGVDCATCNDWFRDWRLKLSLHRQMRQQQIYIQEMLK